VEVCVFGFDNPSKTLTYKNFDNSTTQLSISSHLKKSTFGILVRTINPLRFFSNVFDKMVIGSNERIAIENADTFKAYILDIIKQRK
jgi:hypothetical protein